MSYSCRNYQIKPNFTVKKPNLDTGNCQKCGKKQSDSITFKESNKTRRKLSKWRIQMKNCEQIKIKSADCLVYIKTI